MTGNVLALYRLPTTITHNSKVIRSNVAHMNNWYSLHQNHCYLSWSVTSRQNKKSWQSGT